MSGVSDYVRSSAVLVIACNNTEAPDEVCEAIGRAMVMSKPILCIVKPGIAVPEKLSMVVDRFVEWDSDPNALAVSVKEVLLDMGLLQGECKCDGCKEKADQDATGPYGEHDQN